MFRPHLATPLRVAFAFVVLGFASSARAQTTINFTPGFGFSTSPVLYQGVTFSTLNGSGVEADQDWGGYFATIPGASLGNALNDSSNQSAIVLKFSVPVTQVSLLLSTFPVTTWTMTAFDALNNQLDIDTATSPAQSQAVRATVGAAGISYVTITEATDNGNVTLLDDVTFTSSAVPEPGSLALFAGMGTIGTGFFVRRKRAGKAANE